LLLREAHERSQLVLILILVVRACAAYAGAIAGPWCAAPATHQQID